LKGGERKGSIWVVAKVLGGWSKGKEKKMLKGGEGSIINVPVEVVKVTLPREEKKDIEKLVDHLLERGF